ncbi:hypothetical protein B0H67DRAFT_558595 [Lasiosphaeris hirsuta]|uniref:Ubiquitin-like protease family profile domain-containing protein n=1 Tax=Lasiosphaeris hirsuta TaxID=260670 RepID=A0AA39ZRD5_9PEZI|nr:hypothetical protein B0H67DRAFT_558595 [Lasiosphaeris hirsuta]
MPPHLRDRTSMSQTQADTTDTELRACLEALRKAHQSPAVVKRAWKQLADKFASKPRPSTGRITFATWVRANLAPAVLEQTLKVEFGELWEARKTSKKPVQEVANKLSLSPYLLCLYFGPVILTSRDALRDIQSWFNSLPTVQVSIDTIYPLILEARRERISSLRATNRPPKHEVFGLADLAVTFKADDFRKGRVKHIGPPETPSQADTPAEDVASNGPIDASISGIDQIRVASEAHSSDLEMPVSADRERAARSTEPMATPLPTAAPAPTGRSASISTDHTQHHEPSSLEIPRRHRQEDQVDESLLSTSKPHPDRPVRFLRQLPSQPPSAEKDAFQLEFPRLAEDVSVSTVEKRGGALQGYSPSRKRPRAGIDENTTGLRALLDTTTVERLSDSAGWLDDASINPIFQWVIAHRPEWHTINSATLVPAVDRPHQRLQCLEPQVFLLPLNIGGNHWSCAVVEKEQRQVTIADSLANEERFSEAMDMVTSFIHYCLPQCDEQPLEIASQQQDDSELMPTANSHTNNPWKMTLAPCLGQNNLYDCGVHAIIVAFRVVSETKSLDSPILVPLVRRWLPAAFGASLVCHGGAEILGEADLTADTRVPSSVFEARPLPDFPTGQDIAKRISDMEREANALKELALSTFDQRLAVVREKEDTLCEIAEWLKVLSKRGEAARNVAAARIQYLRDREQDIAKWAYQAEQWSPELQFVNTALAGLKRDCATLRRCWKARANSLDDARVRIPPAQRQLMEAIEVLRRVRMDYERYRQSFSA